MTNQTMPAELTAIATEISNANGLGFPAEVLYQKVTDKISAGKNNVSVNQNDVLSFMVECKEYGLNPLSKQIYGFLSGGKLMTIISQDGYRDIANRNPDYDGYEFVFGPETKQQLAYEGSKWQSGQLVKQMVTTERTVVEWIECRIYLKSRTRPAVFRSYFSESFRPNETWATQPIQRLQNKAFCNAVKQAFRVAGYTEDDREIMEQSPVQTNAQAMPTSAENATYVDAQTGEVIPISDIEF